MGRTAIVGSACAGSVGYYAALLVAGHVIVDTGERCLPLRHSHHRYAIAGPNGVTRLTVPLVGDTVAMGIPLSEVRISEHARWRHQHWGALMAAYGKSPYFEHAAPALHAILVEGGQTHLLALNRAFHEFVVDFMELPIATRYEAVTSDLPPEAIDWRRQLGTKRGDLLHLDDVPYYQPWAERHGFTPGMSILDLLMNEGREGIFTLLDMARRLTQ
ncbi:MAG: WbqC family protein [Muribaculaceae bacterium]|nr:WbqC family protein [Muribaculaceae bacterium]